jgi:hypothetical protein
MITAIVWDRQWYCTTTTVRELMVRVRNVVIINVYLDLENRGGRDFG